MSLFASSKSNRLSKVHHSEYILTEKGLGAMSPTSQEHMQSAKLREMLARRAPRHERFMKTLAKRFYV